MKIGGGASGRDRVGVRDNRRGMNAIADAAERTRVPRHDVAVPRKGNAEAVHGAATTSCRSRRRPSITRARHSR